MKRIIDFITFTQKSSSNFYKIKGESNSPFIIIVTEE